MGVFDQGGLSKTDVFAKGKWFKEGIYFVEIQNCIEKRTRKGADVYIIEAEVLYSNSDDEDSPRVGQKGTQIMTDNDMLLQNIMGFMCALYGVDSPKAFSDEKWAELGAKVFVGKGDKSAAKGMVLRLDCVEITTQAGKPFTVHNWAPATDEDLEKHGVDA